MDWKILAASFAALVIVSSILLGGFGLGDFFSDIISTIGNLLGASPFGGTTSPATGIGFSVAFYASQFSLQTEQGVNMTVNPISLEMFDGEICVDYQEEIIVLRPENTDLSIDLPLQEIVIEQMTHSEVSIEEADFEITSEESGKTTGSGTVEIFDFSGRLTIGTDMIEFDGNASRLSVKSGDSSWELKDRKSVV